MRVKGGDQVRIRFIVDRFHVGTSDEVIEADIRRRIAASSTAGPRQYEDALVAYALKVHHENQRLYRFVTGAIR